MKLDWLLYFKEVARSEHLGKASAILRISPSAVSRAISLLEEAMGFPLFEKHGKRIRLTVQGRQLYDRVDKITTEIENLPHELGAAPALKGMHRLAATNVLAEALLAPAVAKVLARFPALHMDIRSLRSAEVIHGVLRQEFDLGLCFSPQAHPDLEVMEALSGQMHLVVHPRHPVLRSKGIKTLSGFPAILPPAQQGIDICERHPMFEKFSLQPQAICTFDSYAVGAGLVANSDAWSLFPDFMIKRFRNLTKLATPKGWHAPFSVCFVSHRQRPMLTLIEELQAALAGILP